MYFYAAQLLRNKSQHFASDFLNDSSFFGAFLRKLKDAPFYKDIKAKSWKDLPIINIEKFRKDFDQFNFHEINIEIATKAAQGKIDLPNSISAGFSTGTSGKERGIFLSTETERVQYIATILGKLFNPKELLEIRKIGLCLRSGNALYNSGLSKRIDFRFFQLELDKKSIAQQIIEFAPDILIAPTQILIEIAKSPQKTHFKRVFYGAEAMNASEKKYIEAALGIVIRPIYQATEGFLGIGCEYGNLHLNEDIIAFEKKQLTDKRFIPIISDLHRNSQKVARLELDDILEIGECACKNRHQVIKPNIVRKKDVWKLDKIYFPDEIEKIIAEIIPAHEDYIVFGSPHIIEIALENAFAFDIVSKALEKFELPIRQIDYSPEMNFPKRRHIRWTE